MYYNEIYKKNTECEYRFKTEDELKNEFNVPQFHNEDYWRCHMGGIGWASNMDVLFGKDLDLNSIREDRGLFNNQPDYGEYYAEYNIPNLTYSYYNITKNMITKNKFVVDYNKPKKLVYENMDSIKYDYIVFKCKDIWEVKKVVNIALDKGYVFFLDDDEEFDYFEDFKYILFDIREKDMLIDNDVEGYPGMYGSYEDGVNDIYGENSIYIDNFEKLEKIFGIKQKSVDMYNKPKQLVYENNDFKYGNIVFKCKNQVDLKKIQEIAFNVNFIWYNREFDTYLETDKIRSYPIDNILYIVFDTNEMDMINNTDNIEKYINDENCGNEYNAIKEIYGNDTIIVSNVIKLSMLLGGENVSIDMYNKPKELVYESKILKFNKYKI